MGEMEKQIRDRTKNTRLQRAVLSIVESIPDMTTEMLSGSVYKMYKLMDKHERLRKYRSILAARDRLIKNGMLAQNGKFVELTSEGKKKLKEWERVEFKIPRPAKWDGKWRILIFDIPEKQKEMRNKVRSTLQAIGFKHLQHSVWIYPFDCEDFVTLLKADFKIGKNLLYIIAEAVEYDRHLRDFFEVYT